MRTRMGIIVTGMWLAAGALHPARAQPVLDAAAVPYLHGAGRAMYERFLRANENRAVAINPAGALAYAGNQPSLAAARATALRLCAANGPGCALYAENEDVVWPGQLSHAAPPPGPLIETWNEAFIPDPRYVWRGPDRAAGVFVWAHGTSGRDEDERGRQPPPFVRRFNNAGYDIVRFDRAPLPDTVNRAAGWLRSGLAVLRRRGWRRIVVGGQSRGGWNALQMLDTGGLADAVVAVSPAAHGRGASLNLSAQIDDLRRILVNAAPSRSRVVLVQFAHDPFDADADRRAVLMRQAASRFGGLLLIDRPPGLKGHGAGNRPDFGERFGGCILDFVQDHSHPDGCDADGAERHSASSPQPSLPLPSLPLPSLPQPSLP